jgi:hypothetical protein
VKRLSKTTILCLTTLAVALLGAAPAMADEALTPSVSSLEFPATEVHGSYPQQIVSFLNGSEAPTNVKAVEITGSDAGDFSVAGNSCGDVEPTFSCEVSVQFQPQAPGVKSATLVLADSSGTVEVPLSGTGTTGTLSASPLDFSTVIDGESRSEQVSVFNSDAATHIAGVEITGPDASSFSIDYGNCAGNTFYANNSCGVGVRFSPNSPGAKSAQLILTSDASNTPLVVALSGVGAEGPRLSVDPQQALLGNVAIGSTVEQTFTVSNTGDYPLGVQGGFVVSGTPLMFPIVDQTCSGHYVEPGDSCTITVAFKPTALGQKDASIILITNSQAGVSAVGLEGIGVPAGDSSPSVVTAPVVEVPATPAPVLTASPTTISPVAALDVHLRLISLRRSRSRFTVNTGIGALCPVGVTLCRVHTVLTTNLASYRGHGARSARVRTPVLLGSTVTSLLGGQRAAVHGELSRSGLALLERRRHLKVSVMVAIAAPGTPTVMQWRTLKLVARVAPIVEG